MSEARGGSASIAQPTYWWYRARTDLLQTVLEPYVGEPRQVLDVGSADGPSVGWLRERGKKVSLDVDPRGLQAGGICGSALALPFDDESFDVVAAFDVVEHCEPESVALSEIARVLAPGGRFLMSVPAYQWAWSDFDVQNGHHRRYTRPRAVRAVERSGLVVERSTYAFTASFPFFAAERILRRLRRAVGRHDAEGPASIVSLPQLPAPLEKLMMALSRADRAMLRSRDLPFGSSVVVAARKPATAGVAGSREASTPAAL